MGRCPTVGHVIAVNCRHSFHDVAFPGQLPRMFLQPSLRPGIAAFGSTPTWRYPARSSGRPHPLQHWRWRRDRLPQAAGLHRPAAPSTVGPVTIWSACRVTGFGWRRLRTRGRHCTAGQGRHRRKILGGRLFPAHAKNGTAACRFQHRRGVWPGARSALPATGMLGESARYNTAPPRHCLWRVEGRRRLRDHASPALLFQTGQSGAQRGEMAVNGSGQNSSDNLIGDQVAMQPGEFV